MATDNPGRLSPCEHDVSASCITTGLHCVRVRHAKRVAGAPVFSASSPPAGSFGTTVALEQAMTSITRVLLVLTFLGFLVAVTAHHSVEAQEARFSLAVGQSVRVSQYTLVFSGLTRNLPSYDLDVGSDLVAHFPPSVFLPPSGPDYAYANVRIVTIAMSSDGTAVTGIVTAQ